MRKHTAYLQQKQEECLALLRSTGRDGIENLIAHIDRMGFFVAPGSTKHHRYRGGLLCHSLETYHEAVKMSRCYLGRGVGAPSFTLDELVVSTLLHDLCKADILRYDDNQHRVVTVKYGHGHSARSVRKIEESGFQLTTNERNAILWHMGGSKMPGTKEQHFANHPLSKIVFWADKWSIWKRIGQ